MTSLSVRTVSDLTEMTTELHANQPREALAINRGKATSSPTSMVRTHQAEEVLLIRLTRIVPEAVAIERSSKVEEIPSSLEMIEATEMT